MNEEKKMTMRIIIAKDYVEGRLTLETGRAVAYMMDDVLLAGTRTLTAKPSDRVLVGTPQSSEAYGSSAQGRSRIPDDCRRHLGASDEERADRRIYDNWFMKLVPPKNINFDLPMNENATAVQESDRKNF